MNAKSQSPFPARIDRVARLGGVAPRPSRARAMRGESTRWPTLFGASSAFTLIEIMLAISIAAIIMAIGLPAFVNAMKKDDLRKAVSDVVEGCSHARAQAILKGVPMEFVIRAGDGSLAVQRAQLRYSGATFVGDQGIQNGQGTSESHSSASGFSSHLSSDVGVKFLYVNFQDQMEFPEARVRFFPNGTSDEFTMILFSTRGEKKISLDLITGLADVETLR